MPSAPTRKAVGMETVRIAVHVLAMLSKTRKLATSEIQEQLAALGFRRSLRTVQRTMDGLCESFDIERDDSSKPFGYRWTAGARGIGLPLLDERESLVLLLARQHLQPLLPASVLRALDPMFHEARCRLDPWHGQDALRAWPSKVGVVSQLQPLQPPALVDGVLDSVTESLRADEWLDVDYRNAQGAEVSGRRVMPLALVQQGARLFLVCRFQGYEDCRHLALHRIQRAAPAGHYFDRPAFDLGAYIEDGRFGFGYGERITLRLRVAAEIAMLLEETPVSEDQVLVQRADGSCELTATVVRSEQLRWWLRTYGALVHVVAPEGLLDEPAVPGRPLAAPPAST